TGLGTVTVLNSTLTVNAAVLAGCIYNAGYGKLTITGSTLSDNTATGNGGGILDYGSLTLSGSTLTRNSAGQKGRRIYIGRGPVTVKNDSSISGNPAPTGFGADVDNLGVLYWDGTGTLGTLDGNPAKPI